MPRAVTKFALAEISQIMAMDYHKPGIQHARPSKKRGDAKARLHPARRVWRAALLGGLLSLAGCDPVQIIEGSDTHVSIRYDGVMNGLDQATELARRSCAQHGKTARLRKTYYEGLGAGERFAFFDCV